MSKLDEIVLGVLDVDIVGCLSIETLETITNCFQRELTRRRVAEGKDPITQLNEWVGKQYKNRSCEYKTSGSQSGSQGDTKTWKCILVVKDEYNNFHIFDASSSCIIFEGLNKANQKIFKKKHIQTAKRSAASQALQLINIVKNPEY
jgi:hypothetical protein